MPPETEKPKEDEDEDADANCVTRRDARASSMRTVLEPFCTRREKVGKGGLSKWTCLRVVCSTDDHPFKFILSGSSSKVLPVPHFLTSESDDVPSQTCNGIFNKAPSDRLKARKVF